MLWRLNATLAFDTDIFICSTSVLKELGLYLNLYSSSILFHYYYVILCKLLEIYISQDDFIEFVVGGNNLLLSTNIWLWTIRDSISGHLVLPQPTPRKFNRRGLFDYVCYSQLASHWRYDHMQHRCTM